MQVEFNPAVVTYLRYENPDSGETVELNRAISSAEFAGTFEAWTSRLFLTQRRGGAETQRPSFPNDCETWSRRERIYQEKPGFSKKPGF